MEMQIHSLENRRERGRERENRRERGRERENRREREKRMSAEGIEEEKPIEMLSG